MYKKNTDVVPKPDVQNQGVKVGSFRLSMSESELKISDVSATNADGAIGSIIINSNGSITINKISVVGGVSSNSMTRISVTPSDKAAAAQSNAEPGSCLSLSETQSFIVSLRNKSESELTQADICKMLDIAKCVLQNPSQYGTKSSDLSSAGILTSAIKQLCSYINCPSCSALLAAIPAPASKFTFNGKDYAGDASCPSSSSGSSISSSNYSIYNSENSSDYFIYSESSTTKNISMSIGGKSYYSSSSTDISVSTNGNTKNVSGKVTGSSSSSTADATIYNVSATIVCK